MMLKPKSIAEKIGVTTQTLMSWRKKGLDRDWETIFLLFLFL